MKNCWWEGQSLLPNHQNSSLVSWVNIIKYFCSDSHIKMYINYTGLIKKFVSLLVKTKHYKWHLTSFKKFIFVTVVITARNFFFFCQILSRFLHWLQKKISNIFNICFSHGNSQILKREAVWRTMNTYALMGHDTILKEKEKANPNAKMIFAVYG